MFVSQNESGDSAAVHDSVINLDARGLFLPLLSHGLIYEKTSDLYVAKCIFTLQYLCMQVQPTHFASV